EHSTPQAANGPVPVVPLAQRDVPAETSIETPAAVVQPNSGNANAASRNAPEEDLRPLVLKPLDITSPAVAGVRARAAIKIPIEEEETRSYTPLRIVVSENDRLLRFSPQANASNYALGVPNGMWSASLFVPSVEAGIDYEVSPWIAVGVRGGDWRFVQQESVSH